MSQSSAVFTSHPICRLRSFFSRSTGNLDRALDLVKSFAQAYPPSAVRSTLNKLPSRSTRTTLIGARPLVRLFTDVDIPDDAVPPSLTFTEVEVLHHKLVAASPRREKDIKYLGWLCRAYEGTLRARRDAAWHAKPVPESADVREGEIPPQNAQDGAQ